MASGKPDLLGVPKCVQQALLICRSHSMGPQKACTGWANRHVSFRCASCRYVQLPINPGMTEAWEQRWQTVKTEDSVRQLTFMQAAARLGVGAFASAALKEGTLLLDSVLEVNPPAY